jgi:hypothetical protein
MLVRKYKIPASAEKPFLRIGLNELEACNPQNCV